MIRKEASLGDWIRDSLPWQVRFLDRTKSSLFSDAIEVHFHLDIAGKIGQAKNHENFSGSIIINNQDKTELDTTIEIRGKHRSLLPMLGITFSSPPEGFDDSYHLILLEDEEALKHHPIKEIDNASVNDMFWMEYFSYKTMSTLTDCALDCRLCEVTLVSEDINVKTKGILIESFNSIANRIGAQYQQQQNSWIEICDLNTLRLLELYIGNLDYSVGVDGSCLVGHNVFLSKSGENIFLIPYDFQFLTFTASNYEAYKLFSTKNFLQAAKQDIQSLFPLVEHMPPLISLVDTIPYLDRLCKSLPLSDSVKQERLMFSIDFSKFIQSYISTKKEGDRVCQ